jgi:hypothetical protein
MSPLTDFEKAVVSHTRASQVINESIAANRNEVGWPDHQSKTDFALALLADAVRHLIAHVQER